MQAEEGLSSDIYMDESNDKKKKNKNEKTITTVAKKVSDLKEDASKPENYSQKESKEVSPSLLNQSEKKLPEID